MTVLSLPETLRAQPSSPVLIGILHSGSPDPRSAYWPAVEAFKRGLGESGFQEPRNLSIEYRWAEDNFERLPALARELVQHHVSLIFAGAATSQLSLLSRPLQVRQSSSLLELILSLRATVSA